jgi:hypothetical protein
MSMLYTSTELFLCLKRKGKGKEDTDAALHTVLGRRRKAGVIGGECTGLLVWMPFASLPL